MPVAPRVAPVCLPDHSSTDLSDTDFSRRHRLTGAAEFKRIFRSGKRTGNDCFRLIILPHAGHPARLGLTVPKRVLNKAHDRNRVKRIIRETFRKQKMQLAGHDLVVMAQIGCRQTDKRALRKALQTLFERSFERIKAKG